jgi:two-component system cell cycle response regulator CpdR
MAEIARILIVDDDSQLRGVLSLTFENAGYYVKTAASGDDAIAILTEERFDLMLSDIMMPGMNGHQLAQWVAAHCPATRTALMSGYDGVREPHPYQTLPKPFSPKEVLTFVEKILASR